MALNKHSIFKINSCIKYKPLHTKKDITSLKLRKYESYFSLHINKKEKSTEQFKYKNCIHIKQKKRNSMHKLN